MADGAKRFYAYPFCGELDKTALAVDVVDSIGLAMPPLFSRPLRLCASAGASCLSPIPLTRLVDDVSMMSCRHRIRFRLCSPCLRDTCHVIWLSCCLVPLLTRFALSPRFSSLRLFAPPLRVVERGDVILRALGGLFALSARYDIRSAEGACCLPHGRRCGDVDNDGVVISSCPCSPVRRKCGACRSLRACLSHHRFHCLPPSRIAPLPASPPSRLLAPSLVSMSGERLVLAPSLAIHLGGCAMCSACSMS